MPAHIPHEPTLTLYEGSGSMLELRLFIMTRSMSGGRAVVESEAISHSDKKGGSISTDSDGQLRVPIAGATHPAHTAPGQAGGWVGRCIRHSRAHPRLVRPWSTAADRATLTRLHGHKRVTQLRRMADPPRSWRASA
eukprot:scaffold23472_cov146-Isochrysis_galbana.AAC.1